MPAARTPRDRASRVLTLIAGIVRGGHRRQLKAKIINLGEGMNRVFEGRMFAVDASIQMPHDDTSALDALLVQLVGLQAFDAPGLLIRDCGRRGRGVCAA